MSKLILNYKSLIMINRYASHDFLRKRKITSFFNSIFLVLKNTSSLL